MLVGEQAYADFQRLLIEPLGLNVFAADVEDRSQVIVALRGLGAVVREQAAADLQRLLE